MTPYDLIVLVSCTTFSFLPYGRSDTEGIRKRYRRRGWLPPPIVFEVVWFLLYADLSAAMFFFWYGQESDAAYYVGFAAILANIALNGIWTRLYFEYDMFWASLADIFAMLAAAITVIGCCIAHYPSYTAIVAGSLFVPYILWLLAAAAMLVYVGPMRRTRAGFMPVAASQ